MTSTKTVPSSTDTAVAQGRGMPRSGRGAPMRRTPPRTGYVLRVVLAIVAAAVVMFPLYWMLVIAFSPRGEVFQAGELRFWPSVLTLENFASVFDRFPVAQWFVNSLVISTFTTAFTVVLNLLAGYAFARVRFPGRNMLFILALATLMIPVQAIMVAQFKLVTGLEISGTYWAVILPGAAAAFGIFLARQFFLSIPQELIEAARIDGAGHVRVFLGIVLPLSKPLIAVLILLTLLGSWNDFAWPLIALKDADLFTLPIGLLYLKGQSTPDYSASMALALVSVLPMVMLFLAFQRYFVQGFARSGIR
jgi:multiple sugar transport system permease protein